MPRIAYLSWPAAEISGGIKVAFQHVALLNAHGQAAVVATEDGAPLTYGKRLMGLRAFENPAFIATGRPQERG